MHFQKQKLGKNPICYSNKKNKVPRNQPNQGGKRPVLRKLRNIEGQPFLTIKLFTTGDPIVSVGRRDTDIHFLIYTELKNLFLATVFHFTDVSHGM